MEIKFEIIEFLPDSFSVLVRFYRDDFLSGYIFNIDIPLEKGVPTEEELNAVIKTYAPTYQMEREVAIKTAVVPEYLKSKIVQHEPLFKGPHPIDVVYGDELYTPTINQTGKDVPWIPTPDSNVQEMLGMLELTPADTLYDLGCGEGNIIIKAVKTYGVNAVGVELNQDLLALAKRKAEQEGVLDKIVFINADLFTVDLSPATAITMYLNDVVNTQLKHRLENLRHGVKIGSYVFKLGNWEPEKVNKSNSVFMWRVGA